MNDPNSSIAALPTDPESKAVIDIFNTTALEHGMTGLAGFNYHSLKDNIKWRDMEVKKYVPLLQNCMAAYLQGSRARPK